MRHVSLITVGILASLVLFFSNTPQTLAATKQVPCPVIEGVQTSPNGVKTQCVFPNTFTTSSVGAAKFNAGQDTLTKFNLNNFGSRDVVATDSGRPSGSTGATDTTNPGGSTQGSPAPSGGRTWAQYCEGNYTNPACAILMLPSMLGDMLGALTLAGVWWVLATSAYMFFFMAEFLMWLGTTLFDNVVYLLVINMSVFIQNVNAKGILLGWTFVRDLMNIGIIAGFIIVGISTIVQAQQYSANRFLARLIIAALLVNFSYFFAGAIIDSSNFIARKIYESKIVSADKESCTHTMEQAKSLSYYFQYTAGFLVPGDKLCSISKTFTETLNLGSWPELRSNARNNSGDFDSNMTLFIIGSVGGFFYVTVGFIFWTAATLLIGRFIVLILLLITSPIGIAGSNIPYLDEYAKKWWSMLFSQAFFAPVFVALMGIGLHMIHDINSVMSPGNFGDKQAFSNIASGNFQSAMATIPMFMTFFIGVGFLYAALQISRSMSESGKEYFGAIYDGLQKNLGSIYGNIYQGTAANALKFPGMAYDATIGQIARIPIIGGYVGAPIVGIGKMLRQDPGGHPFGASQSNADAAKGTQEYMKGLSENMLTKAAWEVSHPYKAFKKFTHAIGVPFENMMESFMGESVAQLMKKDTKDLTPAQRRKIERYVEGLTKEERDAMTSSELAEIAPYMSAKQFKETMDRSDLNDKQRETIQDSRWKELNEAKEAGRHDDVARMIENMDKTERKILFTDRDDVRTDKQILAALNAKVFDEVSDDSSLWSHKGGAEQLKGIQDYRAGEVAKNPGRMSDSDAKRITDKHVTPEIINNMTPAQARRLYMNTKDAALRAKLASRFPDLAQPGPAAVAADEDAENARKQKEKEDEEKAKKEADDAEEAEKKKKKDDANKKP